jgi:hypothetical protein
MSDDLFSGHSGLVNPILRDVDALMQRGLEL